jgi:tetratricopeptide (TPR) repeat protein
MKQGLENDAIKSYKSSAHASTTNRNQRTRSYLALAEYYYPKPDYVNSGSYYDSALIFIDSKYPDYDQIKAKSLNLNSLVGHLNTIQREDSLQRVAKMTEQQRTALINSIIDKVKEDEKNKKPGESQADRYNLGQYYENERRFQGNIDQEGKWYFYNQSAMTFGRTEFRRRWGDRKLEDNWRRLDKSRVASAIPGAQQEETTQVKTDSAKTLKDNKKPEFYMRNLPLTDSLLSVSNDRIADAYLESGKVYAEKFKDNAKAVGSFEKLIERYPGDLYEPEALYNIYKIYTEEHDQKAELYKEKLVQKYPQNEFTKIITDPAYFSKLIESKHESEKMYNAAYDDYLKDDFKGALEICGQAILIYTKDDLIPKFMLLKSYCIAKTADERTFKESLNTLIKAYPSTAESAKATEIIAFLNNKIPELKVEEDKQIASEIYVDEMDSPHTFVIIIKNPSFNLNQATFDLISYNIDNYTNKNLKTQGSLIDDKYIMLTVSGFQKTDEAMDYYRAFRTDGVIRNPSGSKIESFIIGKTNLAAFQKYKNTDRYVLFFREKYLHEEIKK